MIRRRPLGYGGQAGWTENNRAKRKLFHGGGVRMRPDVCTCTFCFPGRWSDFRLGRPQGLGGRPYQDPGR